MIIIEDVIYFTTKATHEERKEIHLKIKDEGFQYVMVSEEELKNIKELKEKHDGELL